IVGSLSRIDHRRMVMSGGEHGLYPALGPVLLTDRKLPEGLDWRQGSHDRRGPICQFTLVRTAQEQMRIEVPNIALGVFLVHGSSPGPADHGPQRPGGKTR